MSAEKDKIAQLARLAQSRDHAIVLVAASFPNLDREDVEKAVDHALDTGGDGPSPE